jgi:glycosyltransferase involved in cell wall biosynthesis
MAIPRHSGMRVLLVSGRPHFPQALGGVARSTHDLALALQERGHRVSVLCGLAPGGAADIPLRAMQKLFSADRVPGYPVFRRWNVLESLDAVLESFSPDIAIVQIGNAVRLARKIEARGIPVFYYLHNVDFEELGGDPRTLLHARFIANSEFTARRYRGGFGIDAMIIPPLVHAASYIAPRNPANVTFVNPYPEKGRDIALEVVRACPQIPFTFIESWPLSSETISYLRNQAGALPNLTLRRRTRDMKSVYSKAKLILAPSLCEEAWGRSATEAHFSGIPVVASNKGGLPESVGPGGVLIDPDGPVEAWIEAVTRLWSDEIYYREMSRAAMVYSRRPDIRPEVQIGKLTAVARSLVEGMPRSPAREHVSAAGATPGAQ